MSCYALGVSDSPVSKSETSAENVTNDKTVKRHSRGVIGTTLALMTVLNRQPASVNDFSPPLLNDRVRAQSAVID